MRPASLVSLAVIKFAFYLASGLILTGCGSGNADSDTPSPPTASLDPARREFPDGPGRDAFDDAHPVVVLHTTQGDITVELDQENVPITVANFLAYVGRGQYEGTLFHQVDAGYMALAGGFYQDLTEVKPSIPIRNEAHHAQQNLRGTIAMARIPDVVDSATTQFFFNLADNPHLDHKDRTSEGYGYCVFGKVTAGMDVLDKISATSVTDKPDFPQTPATPIVIESIQRVK